VTKIFAALKLPETGRRDCLAGFFGRFSSPYVAKLRAVLSRTARFFEPIAKIVRNPKRGLLTRPP
jgi:hypothetical protein